MPNPRLRFEPEFRRFRPRICGCFTGGVHVFFSARGRKLDGPSLILAAKVLKFGNRDFEGPGKKYPGKSGCRKPQFAGVGKKPWKLMERQCSVFFYGVVRLCVSYVCFLIRGVIMFVLLVCFLLSFIMFILNLIYDVCFFGGQRTI